MKRIILNVVTSLVLSICIASRLGTLGWLFPIGFASLFFIGGLHIWLHLRLIQSPKETFRQNILKISLWQLCLTGFFMFQFDFGDHRSYFVFELVFNLQNETPFLIGAIPAIIFSIVYAVYTFQLVKLTQMRDKQIKVWVDALIALLLMVGMVYGLTKLYYLMI